MSYRSLTRQQRTSHQEDVNFTGTLTTFANRPDNQRLTATDITGPLFAWSDSNGDGYADGYVQNGTYYAGTPSGYDPTLRRVVTGAAVGAVGGAALGAVVGGLSPIEGAIIGAAVGGLAGAVWADNDRDGAADGYVYNGQYYQGQPSGYAPSSTPPPMAPGERG